MIRVAVVNRSTVLTDAAVAALTVALQIQAYLDFAPAWSMESPIVRFGAPAPGDWQLVLFDDTDQADDLGYHECASDGSPLGRVFVRTIQSYGVDWRVPTSHELLEMLGDPNINRMVALPDGSKATVEVADPVASYAQCYEIAGQPVSNFVLPSWFRGDPTGPYDHLGLLTAPAPAILPGGYIEVLKPGASAWTPIYGAAVPDVDRIRNRHLLRATPREQWRRSIAGTPSLARDGNPA